jgi:tRNA-specific 2-thiouridylase
MLTTEMLERTVFPLGELTKDAARILVDRRGITAAEHEESQELCFIPEGDYKAFLSAEGMQPKPGIIVNSSGDFLGEHTGIEHFTVGQRRGLGICGPEPLYVVRIDPSADRIVVGTRQEASKPAVRIVHLNVLRPDPICQGESFLIKVRSNARPVPGKVVAATQSTVELCFDEPQCGVAPGQAAVLYSGDRVVAGGWIEGTGHTF